jgi:hypothetical protein
MPRSSETTKFEWTRLPKPKRKGPKLARTIRHDVKRLFHELYEKAKLLREVDPSFDEEMKQLGFDKPFDLLTRATAPRTAPEKGGG